MSDWFNSLSYTGIALVVVAFSLGRIALAPVYGALVRRLGVRIYDGGYPAGQIKSETRAAFVGAGVEIVLLAALLMSRSFQWQSGDLATQLWTFAGMYVAYEIWFYACHRALHHRKLFFLHRQHHIAHIADPMSALSFSMTEKLILDLGLYVFPAAASWWLPLGCEGLVAYWLYNYFTNVMGHSNVELFPRWLGRTPLAWVFGFNTFHAEHHARSNGHFGLFTAVLDRLCGTMFDDHTQLFERVAGGQPVPRLSFRISPEESEASTVSPSVATKLSSQ